MALPKIEMALAFDDVLLVPHYSEVLPKQACLKTQLTPNIRLEVPFLSAAMDTVTDANLAAEIAQQGGLGIIHKNNTIQGQADAVAAVKAQSAKTAQATQNTQGQLHVGAAVGIGDSQPERADALIQAGADVLVVDTAHGHTAGVLAMVRSLRRQYPQMSLIAGNVATAEATYALLEAGADVVKVGIGPGSICTTRLVAGVGIPQLSAIMRCVEAARSRNAQIIADGGIRVSGDIVKALAAGASAVMMGGLFAGTDEAPGTLTEENGRKFKHYRGMGSIDAMQAGSADRYFQDAKEQPKKLVAEGVSGKVPAKGPLAGVFHQLAGGLRSGMGYLGAADLKSLYENAQFVQMSAAGMRESAVHDVLV